MNEVKETTGKTKRVNSANLIVRESITEALLSLMKKKQFADITITELTKKAGVGRVSFYRNYESKEDVLLQYMVSVSADYWKTHHTEDPAVLWKILFELFELMKPTVKLMHKAGIDSLLYTYIKECTKSSEPMTTKKSYERAMYTGLAFGLYDRWISGGMKETPEELSAFFQDVFLPYTKRERESGKQPHICE